MEINDLPLQMFQDYNGNSSGTSMMLPCIYEDRYLDVGVVPSYHDVERIVLECQEDIDWDDVEQGTPHKPKLSDHTGIQKGHVIDVVIEENDVNMYDDDQPPNLTFLQSDHSKPGILIQNTESRDSLLHLWRESSVELADESAESTQVNLSQEDSEGYSLDSEELSYYTSDGFTTSLDSINSETELVNINGSSTTENNNIDVANNRSYSRSSSPSNESYRNSNNTSPVLIYEVQTNDGNTHTNQPSIRSISPVNVSYRSSNNVSPVLIYEAPTTDQSVPTFDRSVSDRTYYMSLRSVSPELARSPSPISSRSSSPRFMRSPSPLHIFQSFVQVPTGNSHNVVFYDDRFILRTHSPINTTDHEVPDVDLEYQSVVEMSEEFPSYQQYQRSRRVMSSCFDDQVVPDFIEE